MTNKKNNSRKREYKIAPYIKLDYITITTRHTCKKNNSRKREYKIAPYIKLDYITITTRHTCALKDWSHEK